jgi:hypothetical protein
MDPAERWFVFTAAMIVLLIGLIFYPALVRAHDHGRPGLDSWYQGLKSKGGGPCCDGPGKDATHLADADWESKDGRYRVRVEGEWLDVPNDTVLTEPNRDGRTLVWIYHANGRPIVRCFIPGMMT